MSIEPTSLRIFYDIPIPVYIRIPSEAENIVHKRETIQVPAAQRVLPSMICTAKPVQPDVDNVVRGVRSGLACRTVFGHFETTSARSHLAPFRVAGYRVDMGNGGTVYTMSSHDVGAIGIVQAATTCCLSKCVQMREMGSPTGFDVAFGIDALLARRSPSRDRTTGHPSRV